MVESEKMAGPSRISDLSRLAACLLVIFMAVISAACTGSGSDENELATVETPTAAARSLENLAATATAMATKAAPTQTFTPEPVDQGTSEANGGGSDEDSGDVISAATATAAIDVTDSLTVTAVPAASTITPTRVLTAAVPVGVTPTYSALAIDPAQINGIPVSEIAVMDAAVEEQVREIFNAGQLLGRDPTRFSKLGDSLIATPDFLTQFDKGLYNLGAYSYLQPAIDHYVGSFERYGVALRPGLHAWGVFDPLWADKEWCQANEDLLACEFRLNNPSVLLILLGTNDSGSPEGFDYNMRQVVAYAIDQGVIPVIATKADRFEGPENTNNIILRQIAADYQIPLWDFDLVAETLPNRGLKEDQVHLTVFLENNYTLPEAYESGHGVHNLSALMILESIRQAIAER